MNEKPLRLINHFRTHLGSLKESFIGSRVASRASLTVVVAAVLGFAFVAQNASAAMTEPSVWIGGAFGLTVPNADNSTARPIYGLTAGAKLGTEYGLGVYYFSSQKKETPGNFNYDLYGIEFGYHFEGDARGVYFGGRVGTSKLRRDTATTTASPSPFHFGVMAGYNYFLGDHFSIGADASFMSVASASDSGNPVSSFTMLNFMGTAKVWF